MCTQFRLFQALDQSPGKTQGWQMIKEQGLVSISPNPPPLFSFAHPFISRVVLTDREILEQAIGNPFCSSSQCLGFVVIPFHCFVLLGTIIRTCFEAKRNSTTIQFTQLQFTIRFRDFCLTVPMLSVFFSLTLLLYHFDFSIHVFIP